MHDKPYLPSDLRALVLPALLEVLQGLADGGELAVHVLLQLLRLNELERPVAPIVADKSASGSLAAACAWAMTADAMTAGASVGTSISKARLTLAAVTRSAA